LTSHPDLVIWNPATFNLRNDRYDALRIGLVCASCLTDPFRKMMARKLIIQIPCYNEAGTLSVALAELPRSAHEREVGTEGRKDHQDSAATWAKRTSACIQFLPELR